MISGLGPREVLQVGMKSELWVTASGEIAKSQGGLEGFSLRSRSHKAAQPILADD